VFEAHYGVNFLRFSAFTPELAVDGDYDGDGMSNIAEYGHGTDPTAGSLAVSPPGFILPKFVRNPEDRSWNLSAYAPPGKRLTLQTSSDLLNWESTSTTILGTGQNATLTLKAPPDPTIFFRVQYTDAMSDTDELTDYEEGLLGTDPRQADTDGDRVDDASEFLHGLDPLAHLDTDGPAGEGDGLPDDWEQLLVIQAASDWNPENNPITSIDAINGADDFDGDGLSNFEEWNNGTDPAARDDLTAKPDLKYAIIDLGLYTYVRDMANNGWALFDNQHDQMVRWHWGSQQILADSEGTYEMSINANGYVIGGPHTLFEEYSGVIFVYDPEHELDEDGYFIEGTDLVEVEGTLFWAPDSSIPGNIEVPVSAYTFLRTSFQRGEYLLTMRNLDGSYGDSFSFCPSMSFEVLTDNNVAIGEIINHHSTTGVRCPNRKRQLK